MRFFIIYWTRDKTSSFHQIDSSFRGQHFIFYSVWVWGFASQVSLLPKIVTCGWCLTVLLLWQRLIFSLIFGGRNQMRLWSGGCHRHINKLLMNSLAHNAFVPLDGCSVGWVGWWGVCRDMGDVRGFDVWSFILGSAPKAPGQQHLFSCCLVFVVR